MTMCTLHCICICICLQNNKNEYRRVPIHPTHPHILHPAATTYRYRSIIFDLSSFPPEKEIEKRTKLHMRMITTTTPYTHPYFTPPLQLAQSYRPAQGHRHLHPRHPRPHPQHQGRRASHPCFAFGPSIVGAGRPRRTLGSWPQRWAFVEKDRRQHRCWQRWRPAPWGWQMPKRCPLRR